MLSNLLSQLKMLGALDKFDEALLETPRVRADMGYPPLVTPTSQLIGTQAVQNVLSGERYKNVGAEMQAYCRGEYGRTPPHRPGDTGQDPWRQQPRGGPLRRDSARGYIRPGQRKAGRGGGGARRMCSGYIAFPQVAERFFEKRRAAAENRCRYSIERV